MSSSPESISAQPRFVRFFAGQCASLVGSWTQVITLLYLLYRHTGTATTVAFATGAQAAAMLTAACLVGPVLDRFSPTRVIACAQLVSISVSGYCWLVENSPESSMLVIVGLVALGAFGAAEGPARQALAFDLLGPDRIVGAGGLFGLAQSASRVAGAGISASLIAASSVGSCFAINAASSVVLLCIVLGLPGSTCATRTRQRSGLVQILRADAVRVPFVVLTITGVVGMNYQVLLPVMSGRGAGAGVLHAALTAALGAGALTGSVWAARRRDVHRAQLSCCAAALAAANGVLVLAAAGASWLSAPALAAAGACVSVLFATTTAQLQLSAHPARRVQTMSLVAISVAAATFVGDPIVGVIVRYGGLRAALVASCITAFVAAAYAFRHPFPSAAALLTPDVALAGRSVR